MWKHGDLRPSRAAPALLRAEAPAKRLLYMKKRAARFSGRRAVFLHAEVFRKITRRVIDKYRVGVYNTRERRG